MSDRPPRGRLFVITGGGAAERAEVAGALAERLERSVVIEAAAFDAMIVSGRSSEPAPPDAVHLPWVRQLLLRWSAALATAETYQLEGYDAVVTDDLTGDRLEDFLDLVAPETVLLVALDDGSDLATPRWGLWVRSPDRPAGDLADVVLSRLAEAAVATDPGAVATI